MRNHIELEASLRELSLPGLPGCLGDYSAVKSVQLQGDKAEVMLHFGFPVQLFEKDLLQNITHYFATLDLTVSVHIQWKVASYKLAVGMKGLPQVKNIIAVASGKGGVGKSTTTVNLALALAVMGARVGILDADIYGPNQPQMLGVTGQPEISADKKFEPMLAYGVQSMSIGYLLEQTDKPIIWRGPMVSSALLQLLNDTLWQDLDYLFIDLPPGTGDVQLTLSQKVPVTGALIVTTPQDIALLDARKAVRMFEKVKVPVLGVVENMSYYICPQCGCEQAIFGTGGGEKMAADYAVEHLGSLPLALQIRADVDQGYPTVVAAADSDVALRYKAIALKVALKLAEQGKDYMRKFPDIRIE